MRAQSIFLIEFFEIEMKLLANWAAPKSISLTTKFLQEMVESALKHCYFVLLYSQPFNILGFISKARIFAKHFGPMDGFAPP